MEEFICKNCGILFKAYKLRGKDRVFCSFDCKSEFSHIFKECEFCGKTFKTLRCHNHRFCSQKCSNSKTMKERSLKTKKALCKCIQCGKIWYIKESEKRVREKHGKTIKFCSLECYKKNKERVTKCSFCGKNFNSKRTSTNFCSKDCYCKWKINKHLDNPGSWYENGYKVIYIGGGKGVKEHIKIMEDYIGRKIDIKNENVHHINKIRDDNRLENLKLMTKEEHSRLHRKKEIFEGKPLFGRDY